MKIPQIALVIPTCNRPALLAGALDSVARQTAAPHEVIVVDDGDRQDGRAGDVVAAAVDAGLRARYVRNAGARSAAAARNFGARIARSSVFSFLDDDDVLKPNFTARTSFGLRPKRLFDRPGRQLPKALFGRGCVKTHFQSKFGGLLTLGEVEKAQPSPF